MTSKEADSVRRGPEEALAYAEGTADAGSYGVHVPTDIDVKAIRTKLDIRRSSPGASASASTRCAIGNRVAVCRRVQPALISWSSSAIRRPSKRR
jgi:hypothetical protein